MDGLRSRALQYRQVPLSGSRYAGPGPSSSTSLKPGSTSSTSVLAATLTNIDTVVVTPRSTPRRTSTATDIASATPMGFPYFTFTTMPSPMDTCGSATVDWQYLSSAPRDINLLVSSTIMPNPGDAGTPIIDTPIALNIDATSYSFTWSPVNLTAGRYIMRATGPGVSAESSIFTILNGTDTSCLYGPSVLSSPAAKVVPDATETTHVRPTTLSTTSATTPAVPHPAPSAARRSHSGIVAGGIVGGIAVFFLVLVAVGYVRRRRRPSGGRGDNGAHESEKTSGGWAGLSSASRSPMQGGFADRPSSSSVELPVETQTPCCDPPQHNSETSPLDPDRRKPSTASILTHSPIGGQALPSHGGSTSSLDSSPSIIPPPAASLADEDDLSPADDSQPSVSSRLPSYRLSADTMGASLLGSPAPSSATSQMYRVRDSDTSAWSHWRSLQGGGDAGSRVSRMSSQYPSEVLATMPPLQIAEGTPLPPR